MKLTGETKFFISVAVITILLLIGAVAFLSRPAAEVSYPVTDLAPADAWATGSATPKVTLVEFSDFQCPSCAAAEPVIKQLLEQHKDNLKFVYRHFPLDQHPQARPAAEAAEAAGAQGKFWEMHDALFKNQNTLSKETINGIAVELKLDMERFTKEIQEGKYKDKVNKDQSDGIRFGVNATPTFYINGKKFSSNNLNQLPAEIEKVINEAQ